MKTFHNLMAIAICAAMPFVLQAQYPGAAAQFDTQMSQASSAQQQRDAQANSTSSAPRKFAPYTGLDGKLYQYPANPTKENVRLWKEARAARKRDNRQKAREKDEAKHGKHLPGGFRALDNGDLVRPDGTVVGEEPSKADAKRNKENQKLLKDLEKTIEKPN